MMVARPHDIHVMERLSLEPHLRRTYFALAFPGGPAADEGASVTVGTGHVVEHLLSRQSDWKGGFMDQLGCEFALYTNPEVMTVFLAVPSDADPYEPVSQVLDWWIELDVSSSELASELPIVSDELNTANRQVRRRLWQSLMVLLAPGSHLVQDVGGTAAAIETISLNDVHAFHAYVKSLPCSVFGVGPNLAPHTVGGPPWIPPHPAPADGPVTVRPPAADDDAVYVICAARRMDGLTAGNLGALICFSALRFAKLHPTQRAFIDMGLKFLRFELVSYSGASFVTLTSRVPGRLLQQAYPLILRALDEPVTRRDLPRARRACVHRLEAKHDDPRHLVQENALRGLVGAVDLETTLATVKDLDDTELYSLTQAAYGVAAVVGRSPNSQ